MTTTTRRERARTALGAGLVALAATACTSAPPRTETPLASSQPPTATLDQPTPVRDNSETLTLAGGCFWGVQGLFQHVDGVRAAESGYVGGSADTANYEAVETGNTAHTEVVRITFDPAQVTEDQLLQVFFAAVEDPNHLTRLGSDGHARQYQSAIYAQDQRQRDVARAAITQVNQSGVLPGPVVTAVLPMTEFFPAERYHQDFMWVNPTQPYIASTEMPKLANLKRQFPDRYRDKPVLMFAADA